MHGARAVQKQLLEGYPEADFTVLIVWLPMVPGDSERTAKRWARRMRDPRVRHFYDPEKVVGRAFAAETFHDCIPQALRVLPADHLLREHLERWDSLPPEDRVLWDAFLSYSKDAAWADGIPKPSRWAKQVAFFPQESPSEATGTFFADDCMKPPQDSDWHELVRGIVRQAILAEPH